MPYANSLLTAYLCRALAALLRNAQQRRLLQQPPCVIAPLHDGCTVWAAQWAVCCHVQALGGCPAEQGAVGPVRVRLDLGGGGSAGRLVNELRQAV